MNRWFLLAILASLLGVTSCIVPLPFVGGGVAGGGMDAAWVRQAAENYRGVVSPSITAMPLESRQASEQHDRDTLLHRFSATASIPEGVPTDFAGATITYRKQRLSVSRHGRVIISEQLPSAFYYSGLQVASVRCSGVPCLLILTYTRSSTGKVWVGFYRADGDRLYLATMSRGNVWDIAPSPDGFTLLGHSGSLRIALKSQ